MIKRSLCLIIWLFFVLALLPLVNSALAARAIKEYMPGDFVHVMAEAPIDTSKLQGIMPDGASVELVHDRRAKIWHGMWQVPLNFPRGTYSAKIQAVDIEGNFFEGETTPFIITEPSLVMLVEKPVVASRETRVTRETTTTTQQTIIRADLPAAPETPGEKRAVKRPAKKVKIVSVPSKQDLNLAKAKHTTYTRYYLEKMDYKSAREELKLLVKLDPANADLKKMLKRINKLIEAGNKNG